MSFHLSVFLVPLHCPAISVCFAEFCCYFDFFVIVAHLFSNEREEKRVCIWVCEEEARRRWEKLREPNHGQNILYERNVF